MITVYEAIMLAANQIENNPAKFDFMATEVPTTCRTPGCALGWIGHYLGMGSRTAYVSHRHVPEKLGIQPPNLDDPHSATGEFYAILDRLSGKNWRWSATNCAAAMRAYANEFHAPRDLIPANVREIFSRTYTARDLTV